MFIKTNFISLKHHGDDEKYVRRRILSVPLEFQGNSPPYKFHINDSKRNLISYWNSSNYHYKLSLLGTENNQGPNILLEITILEFMDPLHYAKSI